MVIGKPLAKTLSSREYEKMISLLGTLPDYQIAAQFETNQTSIRRLRSKLSISSYKETHAIPQLTSLTQQEKEEFFSLLGTAPDKIIGKKFDLAQSYVNHLRRAAQIESYQEKYRSPIEMICEFCDKPFVRGRVNVETARHHYYSQDCAKKGSKRRDTDKLIYGTGWKKARADARIRDEFCQGCGKTPIEFGKELHVHHKVPFRHQGKNNLENLVALCDSCHRKIENMTDRIIEENFKLKVELKDTILTIMINNQELFSEAVFDLPSVNKKLTQKESATSLLFKNRAKKSDLWLFPVAGRKLYYDKAYVKAWGEQTADGKVVVTKILGILPSLPDKASARSLIDHALLLEQNQNAMLGWDGRTEPSAPTRWLAAARGRPMPNAWTEYTNEID